MHWSLLHSPSAGGATNMARDEAMLTLVRERGGAWLRIYGWTSPVLSLGRHQRARGVYDRNLAKARELEIVRRPTGGRAVLHHREITYAAAAPIIAGQTLRDAASTVDHLLVATLTRIGVETAVARPSERAPVPDGAPCFALPVRGELLAADRKLVGSAQWREEDAWLQHGSILVDDDQQMIAEVAVDPVGQQPSRVSTLRALLGRDVGTGEFVAALREVLAEQQSATGDPFMPTDEPHRRLDEIASEIRHRYEDDEWTWRR